MPIFKHIPCEPATTGQGLLAFVGEAPGAEEECRGRPLVGTAGRMFDRILRHANMTRTDHWIGNVFDEKIPDNDIKNWCQAEPPEGAQLKIPGKGWLREEFHWHFERLRSELEQAQPAVIVPMGATALWAFTGRLAITNARGAVARASALIPGAKILPTFHPMYVQHQFKMLGTVVADIQKALAEATQPAETLTLSARELWLDPGLLDITCFIEKHLDNAACITIDIETAGGQITKIAFSGDSEHAICIPFADRRQPSRSYWQDAESEVLAWQLVQFICGSPIPKLLQNGPYDLHWLLKAGVRVMNWRKDTRLSHHALYPELPKSLAYMGSIYTQSGPWKELANHARADEKRDA